MDIKDPTKGTSDAKTAGAVNGRRRYRRLVLDTAPYVRGPVKGAMKLTT